MKEDLLNKDFEEEVIYKDHFFKTVLTDLGLKKYTDIPEETAKLENCLTLIGAVSADTQSTKQTKFVRLEALIAAMRIHGYAYAGHNLATKLQGVDFRTLTPKSMRIMNRLTRVVTQY